MNKVFLGGTYADSNWRERIIGLIQVKYFNPVVNDWTPECVLIENREKQFLCNIHLYVITNEMQGVYSIAEAVESAMTHGKVTIFHVIPDGFTDGQLRSLKATADLISVKGGIAYIDSSIDRTSRVINNCFK